MASTPSERLKILLKELDINQVEFANRLQIGKSTVSQYVNGLRLPKQNIIFLISRTFNVNEGWLMGFDVPMWKKEINMIADRDVELLDKFNRLSDSQQKIILDMIDSLLGANGV